MNDKFLAKDGFFELICGEGRLIAQKRLGRTHIRAEVVTCTRKQAYLESLVENLARGRPGTMDFARELKNLSDEGWDYERIAQVACRSTEYVRQYIRLVEKGEERLIQGVEQEVFRVPSVTHERLYAMRAEQKTELIRDYRSRLDRWVEGK